jgi:hypothetical protein
VVPETLGRGFVGAFFASVLAIIEEFHTYSLTPGVYYSLMYRLLFQFALAEFAERHSHDALAGIVNRSGMSPSGMVG